ncbi:MAG: 5,10-methylenetetrahydromethanopterin reductase, partial [Solirubrobacteraceae bacterium]
AGARELVSDDMLRLAIVGSVDECIEQIGRLVDAGVTQISLGGPLGPDPGEAIATIGKRIIPAFK